MPKYPLRSSPPWHFRLAKWLIRNRLRGGYRLIELAERRGWLNCVVEYELSADVKLSVPLWRRENQWALPDLRAYESELVTQLIPQIMLGRMIFPDLWIDVGADIGVLSALLASKVGFSEGIVLEPNPVSFEFLEHNAAKLPFPVRAIQAAAADFTGKGTLAHSPNDPSDHARFLAPDEGGDLDVVRIDDLGILAGGSMVMKVDVEGGELAVLKGAAQTLANASNWCVAFEAHRDVVARTGIDPCECVRFLAGIDDLFVSVAERNIELDMTRPFFDQFSDKITNVICTARAGSAVGRTDFKKGNWPQDT
ncbi:MAG: FkbM family methyltransferase [Pirellulaceae bacterium]